MHSPIHLLLSFVTDKSLTSSFYNMDRNAFVRIFCIRNVQCALCIYPFAWSFNLPICKWCSWFFRFYTVSVCVCVCVLYTMNSAYFYNVAFCHPLTEPNESRHRTERIGLALGGIWHLEAPTNNIMHWQTELKKKRNAEYSCSISSTAHRYMCVI